MPERSCSRYERMFWPFLLLALLTSPGYSLHDHFDELWGLSKGRSGRRLQTRDMNLDEMFRYWQKMYGRWPNDVFEGHKSTYRERLTNSGRQWAAPQSDKDFLDIYYFLRNHTEVPVAPGWTPGRDRCAPGCHVYGTCNQELGRCDCPRGRSGPTCATPLDTSCHSHCQHEGQCYRIIREWCINECNGRGSCVGGVCHCFPGYWGSDCALSLHYDGSQGSGGVNRTVLLAGQNYRPNPRGPRIFVYDFPPEYHLWGLLWVDRPLNIILWERITSLGLRVVDPEQADYFFIPGCGRGCNNWEGKFQFITDHYAKYWERRNGRDHLMTHTGDWGRCEKSFNPQLWGPRATASIANLTMLHHWGITVDRSGEVEHELFKPCHLPDQDIQVPVLCGDLYGQFEYNIWHPTRKSHPINKTVLASVTGSICGWNSMEEPPCRNKYYSFGVRAALWQLRDRPGFHIAKRVPVMGLSMAESEFCFAPTGAGHGKRNVVSVTLGCMPVIISDHIAQPFEPFLNWNDFGVWIPEKHIGETETILRGFTAAQKAAKMEKLFCAARHVAYTTVFGGLFNGDTGEFDAVATILAILRSRLRNPGVPDHKLMQVDSQFADFMACKSSVVTPAHVSATAWPPPTPPLPNAAITSTRGATIDDTAFPGRTVTTAAWIRDANGQSAGSGDTYEHLTDTAGSHGELCKFNGMWLPYHDGEALEPSPEIIQQHTQPGQCLPKNANRPAGFPPGGSIACPVAGPITQCAQLV